MLNMVREVDAAEMTEPLPNALNPEQFLPSLYPMLVGSFGLQGFTVEEAEDLAQDTLVRVLRHWDEVTAADSPEGWAFRTASNLSRSWLRRVRLARQRALPSPDASESDTAANLAVRDAVCGLPARQREAVVLRYFAQLTVREAAIAMHCAEGTIRALTFQGIAALRDHFDIDHPESTDD